MKQSSEKGLVHDGNVFDLQKYLKKYNNYINFIILRFIHTIILDVINSY